jgi:transcriptional regulator with XRE-family HTH domain
VIRLTQLREIKGWSKSELARRSRMTPGEVGKIESGRLKPYPIQLRKLARALGISPTDESTLMQDATAVASEGVSHA